MSSKTEESINFNKSIKKLIKSSHPSTQRISSKVLDAISICTKEFAKMLINASAIQCQKHGTLMHSSDIKASLKDLEFEQYIKTVENQEALITKQKAEKPKPKPIDLTEEEQYKLQEKLYREAREKMLKETELEY